MKKFLSLFVLLGGLLPAFGNADAPWDWSSWNVRHMDARVLGTAAQLQIAFGNGVFVSSSRNILARGHSWNAMMKTTDGTNLTTSTIRRLGGTFLLKFGDGKFICYGFYEGAATSRAIFYSEDGEHWTTDILAERFPSILGIAAGRGICVGVSTNGIIRSDNWQDWRNLVLLRQACVTWFLGWG